MYVNELRDEYLEDIDGYRLAITFCILISLVRYDLMLELTRHQFSSELISSIYWLISVAAVCRLYSADLSIVVLVELYRLTMEVTPIISADNNDVVSVNIIRIA
jgi:hypothetical protein